MRWVLCLFHPLKGSTLARAHTRRKLRDKVEGKRIVLRVRRSRRLTTESHLLSLFSASRLPRTAQIPGEKQRERVNLHGGKCKAVPEQAVGEILKRKKLVEVLHAHRHRTHLPYQNVLSLVERRVLVQLHVVDDVVHVVHDAVDDWNYAEHDHADHVLLHVEHLVGAGRRQADERKHNRHAPDVFPPKMKTIRERRRTWTPALTTKALEPLAPRSPE